MGKEISVNVFDFLWLLDYSDWLSDMGDLRQHLLAGSYGKINSWRGSQMATNLES